MKLRWALSLALGHSGRVGGRGGDTALLEDGQIFGRFQVIKCLGRGGMGQVYHACDTRLGGRDVALKIMLPSFAKADPEAGLRFLREAEISSRIRHPSIVTVHDLGIEGDTPYIVMEYLSGQDLFQLLQSQGRLSVEDAVEYLLPVCSAVAAAHRAGVVHRDLKPSNVFLSVSRDGHIVPKVLDFGVAHPMLLDTAFDPVWGPAGTPEYFAPELLIGEGFVGPPADVYALGVTLYELLIGSTPYPKADGLEELVIRLQNRPFPSIRLAWPDVPHEIERIVSKATRAIPLARFGSTTSLARALLPFARPATQARYRAEFEAREAHAGDGVAQAGDESGEGDVRVE